MQALRMAERGSHGFHAGTANVVERILRGKAPAGGLAMRPQRHGLIKLRPEFLYYLGPQHAARAHFGNLHKVILAHAPEEGQAGRERIYIQSGGDTGADVFKAIRKGVTKLYIRGCTGFLNMVAGDGDGVELGHIFCGISENIANYAHGGLGRIDVRIPHHELLEYVVLYGTGQLGLINALLFSSQNVERHYGQHRAVHCH